MGDFTDIFDSLETDDNSSQKESGKQRKPNKQKKPKKEKRAKPNTLGDDIPNPLDDLVDNLEKEQLSEVNVENNSVPKKNKEKKEPKGSKFFKGKGSSAKETNENTATDTSNSTWRLMSKEQLVENEVPEEVEDIVNTPERVIGTRIKTELDINEARGLDLSLRDRIELTRKYLNKDADELRKLEEYRAEDEKRTNHVVTLKNYVLTELGIHLTDTNHELVMHIDAKFGPYIDEAMQEVALGYFVKEIPRNADLVNLNPNLPYKYSFMVRAI